MVRVEPTGSHRQTDQPVEAQVLEQPCQQLVGLAGRLGRLRQARPVQPGAQAARVVLHQVVILIKRVARAVQVETGPMVNQAAQA